MSWGTTLAGFELEHPVMNGGGTVKTVEDAHKALQAGFAAVVIGSITMEPRAGNTGEVYSFDGIRSINSLGMPNPGREYWKTQLRDVVQKAHDNGQRIIVNVAGFSPQEYATLTHDMLAAGADAVELNFGCPNIWGPGGQKSIVSFQPELMGQILIQVTGAVGEDARVGLKLSPYSDPSQLQAVASVINPFRVVKFVTTCNTFPNTFSFREDGSPTITPGGGLGGMAGPAMKAVGLGQVKQLRGLLPAHIQLIGVGGIQSARDVRDYLRAGATAVQVVTHFLEKGKAGIQGILTDLVELPIVVPS